MPRLSAVAIAIVAIVLLPLSTQAAEEAPEPAAETFDRLGTEKPAASARATLTTGQTLHGAILGIQTCVLIECESPRPAIGLPTLGAGAGLGLSLYATHERGITSGHTAAINSGTIWGGWLFLGTARLVDVSDFRSAIGWMISGQVLGTAVGHLAADTLRPTSGDLLMVNSGALWAIGYYMVIMEGLADRYLSGRQGMAEALAVTTAGGVAGGALASLVPMTRGRVALINASGLLGGLAGVGLPIMLAGEDAPTRTILSSMLGGATVGLGLGAYFTREWDADLFTQSSASLSVRPAPDNAGLQVGLSGRW